MSINLAAIWAKLEAPNGWGCEKECGRPDVIALLATVETLRDALRGVVAWKGATQDTWCWRDEVGGMPACGHCAGCLAYDAAEAALKTTEEGEGEVNGG